MIDLPPTKIKIMADYGSSYAWDEEGCCIAIAYYFPNHPKLEQLVALEGELEAWADNVYADQDEPGKLSIEKLDKLGLSLAKKLAGFLSDYGVPVSFVPDGKLGQEGTTADDVEVRVHPPPPSE